MYATTIYDTDSIKEIARKIYYKFAINQSCTIFGIEIFEDVAVPRGELVLKDILALYELEYMRWQGIKYIRKREFPKNSIGGELAHPIFRWEKRIIDNNVRYTIWRIQ